MNDNLNKFLNNMGILCETWIITYNEFIKRGMDHKLALDHTKEFMAAFMEAASKNGGGDQ